MKFVMPDELFDLGYPCLEMFDFLRHGATPLYPLGDLVELKVLITDLCDFCLGYLEHDIFAATYTT